MGRPRSATSTSYFVGNHGYVSCASLTGLPCDSDNVDPFLVVSALLVRTSPGPTLVTGRLPASSACSARNGHGARLCNGVRYPSSRGAQRYQHCTEN